MTTKKTAITLAALSLFLFFSCANSFAESRASFPCIGTLNEAERLVCSDNELRQLDMALSKQFREANKNIASASANRTKQRAWLKQRNLCESISCLETTYMARRFALESKKTQIQEPSKIKFWATQLSDGFVFYTVEVGRAFCASWSGFQKAGSWGDGIMLGIRDEDRIRAYARQTNVSRSFAFQQAAWKVTWAIESDQVERIDVTFPVVLNTTESPVLFRASKKRLPDESNFVSLWANYDTDEDEDVQASDVKKITNHCSKQLENATYIK